MIRPEVSVESRQDIDRLYDFYDEHTQNQTYAMAAHFILSKVYKPTITFAENGAAEEAIQEEVDADTRLLIAPNHLTDNDQYVIVSVAQRVKALNALRGRTIIPTEPSLSSAGIKRGGQLLRWACDGLGSIPIMRSEDYFIRRGVDITPERKELLRYGTIRASQTWEHKMLDQGMDMAAFLESNRNRIDHSKVQGLKKGVLLNMIEVAEHTPAAIIPMGFYFGGEPKDYKKLDVPDKYHPHVHIGMPIPIETSSVDELIEIVHPAIQKCVDFAVQACVDRAA